MEEIAAALARLQTVLGRHNMSASAVIVNGKHVKECLQFMARESGVVLQTDPQQAGAITTIMGVRILT